MKQFEILNYSDKSQEFYSSRIDTLFYSPQWLQVLTDTYGFEFYTALNLKTNHFIIYTIIENDFGKRIMSIPFSDYVQLENNEPEKNFEILRFVEDYYPGVPIIYKSSHSFSKKSEWGKIVRKAYYHRICTRDIESVRNLQSPAFKQQTKQAKKKGVEVRINKEILAVKVFYEIYCQLRFEKFRSIPQPFSFFENIYKNFIAKDKGFILEAIFDEKVIASFIILESNNVLYHKSGCSIKEYLKMRPNNILHDFLIEYAVENNYESIDLGLSGTSENYAGLRKFKDSLGGVRNEITYIQNDIAQQNNDNKAVKALISSITNVIVEQKLDIETTNKFSNILYPFFA